MVFYQWVNHAADAVGKIPLIIGMDETSLAYAFGRQAGTVILKAALPHGCKRQREQVSTQDLRGHVTYIAFMTAHAAIQAILPQIVIGNEHKFTKRMMQAASKLGAGLVTFWREKSAWNSQKLMCKVLSLLAKALLPWAATHQPVLVLDVARSHISAVIWALAKRLGIRLVYIPARLTWLLQPADTHLFFKFKSALRKLWLDAAIADEAGVVSDEEWLRIIVTAIRNILVGSLWDAAFRSNGVVPQQIGISSRVLSCLNWDAVPLLPAGAPTLQQLRLVFPRRMRLRSASVVDYSKPLKLKPIAGAASSKSGASVPSSSSGDGPPSTRTRSRTKAPP